MLPSDSRNDSAAEPETSPHEPAATLSTLEQQMEALRAQTEREIAQKQTEVDNAVRVAMEHKERFAQIKMKLNTAIAENDKLEERLAAQAEEMERASRKSAREIETLQTRIEKLTAENEKLMQGAAGRFSLFRELQEMRSVNDALISTLDKEALDESLRAQNEIIERIAAMRPETVEFGCQVALAEDLSAQVQELQFENRKLRSGSNDQMLVIEGYEKSHKLAMARIEELEAEVMRVTGELEWKQDGSAAEDMMTLVTENSLLHSSLVKSTAMVGKLQRKVVKWKRRARNRQGQKDTLDIHLLGERLKTMLELDKLRKMFADPLPEPQRELAQLRAANAQMKGELESVKGQVDELRKSCHELADKCNSYEDILQESIARVERLQRDNENLVQAFKRITEENTET